MKNDPPSREPSDYSDTKHFTEAFDDDLRFIDREMVDETIIAGVDHRHEGGPGKIRRKWEYDGVDAVVVIALDKPELITAWTEIKSASRALASDRWTMDQLRKIRAFMDEEHKKETRRLV